MPGTTRRADRITGLSILGVAFLGSLCLSWWASVVSAPEQSAEPDPATIEGLTGFPEKVDALKALARARELTPRERLEEVLLVGVASDGTVDFTKPKAEMRFSFDSARGEGPQPPRPKGTLPRRTYCGRQHVRVGPHGIFADPDQPTTTCRGGAGDLPDPVCGPREVWQKALERGVPRAAVARIQYYRSEAGPAWQFEVEGGRYRFAVYGDCRRVLNSSESRRH